MRGPISHVSTDYGYNSAYQTGVRAALCPDLLDYGKIGEADNLRGRVVRAFFWLMRVWPA